MHNQNFFKHFGHILAHFNICGYISTFQHIPIFTTIGNLHYCHLLGNLNYTIVNLAENFGPQFSTLLNNRFQKQKN